MFKWLSKVAGDSNEKEIKRLQPLVARINALEPEYMKLTDEELKGKTAEFKTKVAAEYAELMGDIDNLREQLAVTVSPEDRNKLKDKIITLENSCFDTILHEAFAAVREASRRALGLRHYDVQLIGGSVLHEGHIAEMKTGEGKTLVATLPLYLNSLLGKGAHLITQNDYLARRDAYWMGPVYHALGISVASIYPMQTPDEHQPSRLFDPAYNSGKENDPWKHYRPVPRKEAYDADITYGTSAEFGFDYLRDNMVIDLKQCVQRPDGPYFAIVDEVDNLLIDEARTPLIISAPDMEAGKLYQTFARLVLKLKPETDYEVKIKERQAEPTEDGWVKIEGLLKREGLMKTDNLYDPQNSHLMRQLRNALSAKEFYLKDRQYVVDRDPDGQIGIVIVDEFTGRKMVGRRYSEGLHQAIEAKEGVRVREESKTYASITIQNYFRMYDKLAGMTGTALTEAEEFARIYKLEVVAIPTNRPMIRDDETDQIYKDVDAKFKAVVREVEEMRAAGRPVLLGTVSIENSDLISEMLRKKGIPNEVLNAKKHEREAAIVAEAGKPGAVTVATNMAGRGVDIILGGRLESYDPMGDLKTFLAEELSKTTVDREKLTEFEKGIEAEEAEITRLQGQINTLRLEYIQEVKTDPAAAVQSGKLAEIDEHERMLKAVAEHYMTVYGKWIGDMANEQPANPKKMECRIDTGRCQSVLDKEKKRFNEWLERYVAVVKAGGLHVIGTERHEARRIDNQLRGRSGRQGDPGSSRFFVSLEDDIMRRFGGDMVRGLMERLGFDENTPIENSMISKSIENAQKRVEGFNFDIRKNLVEYDDVVNKHREIIYGERKKILEGADLRSNILNMVKETIDAIVADRLAGLDYQDWDTAGLLTDIGAFMTIPADLTAEEIQRLSADEVAERLKCWAEEQYAKKEQEISPEILRQIERHLMLRVIDTLWIEHLTFVEHLRLEAGWQTLRQVKAVDAYKNEGYRAFEDLLDGIKHDVVHTIFKVQVVRQGAPGAAPQRIQARQAPLAVGAAVSSAAETVALKAGATSPMQAAAAGANVSHAAKDAEGHKVGRNDPCPCGSGKKYKKCCGA
ncbi:preprotein translocase subunit SecA [Dehalogenimonas etheniformans]|uniref:Protein translocase subunit SecA n=1 Tax=Dehalogenimonas etheniformans TaxID=1536648 RepID=A0A2P5P571_9CHLR|nr:preprotein translocase subunit SecA [Dehalogenimonas etheniformans]PPD57441.1 preprotein translocase subunit SecA [Dehalogenimonas etheniformans]QNT77174.1 preprotein translocase subunit SecA [Dehalogenimonas etheniformans]